MIEGVHFVRKQLATNVRRWYVYAFRGGPQIMTADQHEKAKLTRVALAELNRLRQIPDATVVGSSIGTLGDLATAWLKSPDWARKASTTKKTWGSALKVIEAKWRKVPLPIFDDTRVIKKIVAWRDSRAETPRAADTGIQVLRALLAYGIQLGLLQMNAAAKITKLYVDGSRAEIVFTPEDLTNFAATAGQIDRDVDDAVQLAANTGLRRQDLARLTWGQIGGFAISLTARKKSRGRRQIATMPRVPQLDALLERLRTRPRQDGIETVLVTKSGIPWNLDRLSRAVSRIAKEAGLVRIELGEPGEPSRQRVKHLNDARGTFATSLMVTTDLSDAEIASIMGWTVQEVSRIRRIYVDDTARIVALGRRIAGKM